MKGKNNNLLILICSVLYVTLFHKQPIGLNLFIFECLIFILLWYTKQFSFSSNYAKLAAIGFLTTSIFSVITFSIFCIVANIFTFLVFIGLLIFPQSNSLFTSFLLSINNIFLATLHYIKSIFSTKLDDEKQSLGTFLYKSRILAVPLIASIVFIVLYRKSNPYFDKLFSKLGTFFSENFTNLFQNFDTALLFTMICALIFSTIIFYRIKNNYLINYDSNAHLFLKRKRNKSSIRFSTLGLVTEYKSAIVLFALLNIILLIMNILDIYFVWFNFEWKGQYLKQYVHEGTYLLITSILISIALVLYYFRKNLNFYKKNKLLKLLCYVWIFQNVILCFSVAIRNMWYIKYFALAYKRIGVIIFLVLTVYGLFTVYKKVKERRSAYYLFRQNFLAFYCIIVFFSLINWDGVIAKYNFKNANNSFIHLDFLSTLSDKSLPHLNKPLEELQTIHNNQNSMFKFDQKFMRPEVYHKKIENRIKDFKIRWEKKSILSWNLPEHRAYQKLIKKE